MGWFILNIWHSVSKTGVTTNLRSTWTTYKDPFWCFLLKLNQLLLQSFSLASESPWRMYIQTSQENHQTHTALGVLKVPENPCIFCERKRRSSKPNTRPIHLCSYSHREKPSLVCSSWKPALSISGLTTDCLLLHGLENNSVFRLASFLALFFFIFF